MINHLPNFITSLNIVIGCFCIVFVFNGNILWASACIFISSVLDFLDGFTARLLNSFSPLGKQLDSLSDMVVFGIAPAIIIYKMIGEAAFIIPVCSAIRLARFNIDSSQSDKFSGLPTPAAALFFASMPLITNCDTTIFSEIINSRIVLVFITVAISALMVAPVELFSLKMKHFGWQSNKLRYFFIATSMILIIVFNVVAIPLSVILYILLSLINNKFKIQV